MPVKIAGAVLLVAVALAASACGTSHPTSSAPARHSSSVLLAGGAVRCTATVTTPIPAHVGQELQVLFQMQNVSTHQVAVEQQLTGARVVVNDPHGKVYDSQDADLSYHDNGATGGTGAPLQPGETITRRLYVRLVRWAGPLRVIPSCTAAALPAIPVRVTSPGLPASGREAISDVVAATGHLLDHCRPRADGVAVVGRIDPGRVVPAYGHAPPMRARCSVSLRR